MKPLTKQQIREIAHNYYFDIDDNLLDIIHNDYLTFINNLKIYDHFDLTNVKSTDYCTKQSYSVLREDTPIIEKNPEDFTKNAKNKLDKYIVVK